MEMERETKEWIGMEGLELTPAELPPRLTMSRKLTEVAPRPSSGMAMVTEAIAMNTERTAEYFILFRGVFFVGLF